tara:strand:+ start:998 stop:1675 length:678 start_codon:yes stop_codon:yes gene_type:complete
MGNYTFWNKWSTPVITAFDEEYDVWDKKLIKECLRYYKSKNRTEVAPTIKGNLYESNFDFFDVARRKNYTSLIRVENFIKNQFQICFHDYFTHHYVEDVRYHMDGVKQEDIGVNLKESWIHLSNDKGSWHGNHNHPMTSWGAIYYVKVDETGPEKGGLNGFRQPFQNMYTDDGNFFQQDFSVFTIEPHNGQVVFFPANLNHNATPYYGDEQRIVIAANICVKFKR